MAHKILIPASFDYRRVSLEWKQARARISGWWKRDDGSIDDDYLIAEVVSAGAVHNLKLGLTELPLNVWDLCVRSLDTGEDDEEVERLCSGVEPEVFVASRQIRLVNPEIGKNSQPADAWQARNDLLQMAANNDGALKFLNRWGLWSHKPYVELRKLLGLRDSIRQALLEPDGEWIGTNLSRVLAWERAAQHPYLRLNTIRCEEAIRMTVTIDILRGAKFKICKRADCAQPFKVTSSHKRSYCGQYCAHLESVRRNRKRKPHQPKSAENKGRV